MSKDFDNKSADSKKQEQDRRTELAMMGLLIEKHPREAREKVRKLQLNSETISIQKKSLYCKN